ncbi:MAG: N-acetyltransferase [Caldilineales bacterium]
MTPITTLRPITDNDDAFLYHLYASTREEELAVLDWTPQQKEAFLVMQFRAQHTFYKQEFAGSSFDIIELAGQPIGRLYVDRRPDEIRIIDIALLADCRGQGIGSRYLAAMQDEGRARGLPIRIHVESNNPAMSLYRRMGFRKIESNGVYWLMEWQPGDGGRAVVSPDTSAGS